MNKKEFFQFGIRLSGVWLIAKAIVNFGSLATSAWGYWIYRNYLHPGAPHSEGMGKLFETFARELLKNGAVSIVAIIGLIFAGVYCLRGGKNLLTFMRLEYCETPSSSWTPEQATPIALRLIGLCFLWPGILALPKIVSMGFSFIVALNIDASTTFSCLTGTLALHTQDTSVKEANLLAIEASRMSLLSAADPALSGIISLFLALYLLRGAPRFALWMNLPPKTT